VSSILWDCFCHLHSFFPSPPKTPVTDFSAVSLAPRAYSAAAKLKEAEDDFFVGAPVEQTRAPVAARGREARPPKVRSLIPDDGFFAEDAEPATGAVDDGVAAKLQAPPAASDSTSKPVPFSSLKGRMSANTLKAVTFKPFNLEAMSEVQKRVLSLMPELAGGRTGPELIAKETPEETEARKAREAGGRQDLLVKAKTGTGKTIAFLIPAIDARLHTMDEFAARPNENGEVPTLAIQGNIRREAARKRVGALVISPTRELATQIANEALKLQTWYKEMQVQLLVGGANRSQQLKDWKSMRNGRKDIVVATPGRLNDLLSEPEVRDAIANTDMLILDEADTLLEMGFAKDLEKIVDHLPKNRQTFLFSATVSRAIEKVARAFLKPNHTLIDCVPKNESNVHLHIPQYATVLKSSSEQLSHIARLIAQDQLTNPDSKVIVFLPTTKQTMLYATFIRELADALPRGASVHEIHSRLDQDRRSRAAERFRRDKRASVLITSDVSARGVDYPGVTRVIQVGMPHNTDQYVHRVGRTGRGSSKHGRGDIVLLPFEGSFVEELANANVPFQELPAEALRAEVEQLASQEPRASERVATIDSKASEIAPLLDPEAIREVFTSLIGYYLSKGDILRKTPHAIYAGLQEWSTGAAGLPEPPFLSQTFLSKFGLNKPERAGKFDNNRGGRGGQQKKTFGLRPRDGGDNKFGGNRDREGGFRPRRNFDDNDGGFRPRGGFGDREGGFRPRRDNDRDGFRPRRDFGGDRSNQWQQRGSSRNWD